MKKRAQRLKKWIFPIMAACMVMILMRFVLFIGFVPSESMEPTLKKGSYIVACRIYKQLKKGDIIIFRHNGRLLVKRIAAASRDKIERNGVLITIPDDCYYVLGDNAENSWDSRYWEDPFVDENDVVAKLMFQ